MDTTEPIEARILDKIERIRILIERLMAAIRKHRDARGPERCWQNDLELYAALDDPAPQDPGMKSAAEMMQGCAEYLEGQGVGGCTGLLAGSVASFNEGLECAATHVESDCWNDSTTVVNQRGQAMRTAELIRSLKKRVYESNRRTGACPVDREPDPTPAPPPPKR